LVCHISFCIDIIHQFFQFAQRFLFGFIQIVNSFLDIFAVRIIFYAPWFHRDLKRLVAVELKIGKFKAEYMGQMEFYLKWLNKYERRKGEGHPIGIILCTSANHAEVELLEMDKMGIGVAEYWTGLPPKVEFERKIREMMEEARERLERRKNYPKGGPEKNIEYYYESKDDDE